MFGKGTTLVVQKKVLMVRGLQPRFAIEFKVG